MLFNNRPSSKIFSLFVTAGFPTTDATVPLVLALHKAGADIIELGIPFSDPIADGPTIQASSEIALRNGVTLKKTLGIATEIRKHSTVPLVLMGYVNPVLSYGLKSFLADCKRTGVNGTILADLPLEESEEYRELSKKNNIDTIFLAAPTTSHERLVALDQASSGFLYCISITGTTGEHRSVSNQAEQFIRTARSAVTKNPLLVGFGISTPNDARTISRISDGVIIGSALIKIIQQTSQKHFIDKSVEFVKSMRIALDE